MSFVPGFVANTLGRGIGFSGPCYDTVDNVSYGTFNDWYDMKSYHTGTVVLSYLRYFTGIIGSDIIRSRDMTRMISYDTYLRIIIDVILEHTSTRRTQT